MERAEQVGAQTVVSAVVPEADATSLRALANAIRAKLPHGVIALVGTDGENASIFAGASDDAVKAGVHAGNLVKAAAVHVGGKGGGAPAQAQGGGRAVSAPLAALTAMLDALRATP